MAEKIGGDPNYWNKSWGDPPSIIRWIQSGTWRGEVSAQIRNGLLTGAAGAPGQLTMWGGENHGFSVKRLKDGQDDHR